MDTPDQLRPLQAQPLPARFTFPFQYEPHPLAVQAAQDLQDLLVQNQAKWAHNFGTTGDGTGLGKMFGVLVVQTPSGQLGYLAAFSGKLADGNHLHPFVPPVFDTLDENGFYRKEEDQISAINRRIETLSQDPDFLAALHEWEQAQTAAQTALEAMKQAHQLAKKDRDTQRAALEQQPDTAEKAQLLEQLNHQSARHHFEWKDAKRHWQTVLNDLAAQPKAYIKAIADLKEERRTRSAQLQQRLFEHYTFLNALGQTQSLSDIFQKTEAGTPPAGAGECAAPKLLQYAYVHGLKPVALAEFWWGQSPVSEVRQHGAYYPACRGKCLPILGHMLQGLDVDPDPQKDNTGAQADLDLVYEDEYLLVVNKPAEFLSVPGKRTDDSVYTRLRARYPDATGPLVVHRLDMSTSGLLLVAKTKDIHQHLQAQFAQRTIQKRYVALLDGILPQDAGYIDLPLRVDLDDRPRQLVCFEHGKPAQTRWEVVARTAHQTKVHFYPHTGRTHQLRVHAAHPLGLGTPISGDELYGRAQTAPRLCLHAAALGFEHPVTGQWLQVEVDAPF